MLEVFDRRQDRFASLFGAGRGVPGAERELWLPALPALPLLQALTGESALPVGLTLVMGEAGSGHTSVCAMMAAELTVAGQRVLYLDCDRSAGSQNVMALLAAQMPSGVLPPLTVEPRTGKGIESLPGYLNVAEPPSVIILDSLGSAAAAIPPPNNPGYYGEVARGLADFAREHKLSIVASCWDGKRTIRSLAVFGLAHAELALSTQRGTDGGARPYRFTCSLSKFREGNPGPPVSVHQDPMAHLLTVAVARA